MIPSSTAPANRESSSVVQDGPPSQMRTSPELHLCPSSVRIVKRIPCAVTKLAGILGEVTDMNDITWWTRLFTFSSCCITLPKRGGQRRSLATAVNAQLRDESELPTQPPHQSSKPGVTRDPSPTWPSGFPLSWKKGTSRWPCKLPGLRIRWQT